MVIEQLLGLAYASITVIELLTTGMVQVLIRHSK